MAGARTPPPVILTLPVSKPVAAQLLSFQLVSRGLTSLSQAGNETGSLKRQKRAPAQCTEASEGLGSCCWGSSFQQREKSSGVWVWSPGAVADLRLLWAPHGAPDGEADFPWLPGRVDAVACIPPASDSPANPAQPPWLRLPLAILGRCLYPSHAIPLLGGGGHQCWWPGAGQGGTFRPPPPCPVYPTYLTPACQLRLSSPGLCLLGQFPLNNQLNPHLLHSQKLFSLAHQVSETPPAVLCCLGLAPGWFESCHRCSLRSTAVGERRLGPG